MNKPVTTLTSQPNDLTTHWMPFTANRQFKADPRLVVSAKGMYYKSTAGKEVLDGSAGLWCVNAGHCRSAIVDAVKAQAEALDFSPGFQLGHPLSFELANRITRITPDGMDRVFFTNSGSEAVDSALKIALAYHRARGEGSRNRFIGRERGYHGVGFGGISVGGMVPNRKVFLTLPGVDHLPHTYNRAETAFTPGQPEWGAHLADELERIVGLHDASNIAAVIVEPMAGSTGVLPPPQGYLQKLRQICDRHGILLIFDEVITGFGRLGSAFAAEHFGVKPDMITCAKGLTNAVVPMGGVIADNKIYDAIVNAADEGMIELFHGYTYSGHPLAAAAGVATLQVYQSEGVFQNAADLAPYWREAIHSMRDLPNVVDIRSIGIVGAIDLDSIPGKPGKRAVAALHDAFDNGLMLRVTGDTIALSPPLILEKQHIDELVEKLSATLNRIA